MDNFIFLFVGLVCLFLCICMYGDIYLLKVVYSLHKKIKEKNKTLSFLSESWKGMCNELIYYNNFIETTLKTGKTLLKENNDLCEELKKSLAFVKYYEAKCDAMKANCCAFQSLKASGALPDIVNEQRKFLCDGYKQSKYPILPSHYFDTDDNKQKAVVDLNAVYGKFGLNPDNETDEVDYKTRCDKALKYVNENFDGAHGCLDGILKGEC